MVCLNKRIKPHHGAIRAVKIDFRLNAFVEHSESMYLVAVDSELPRKILAINVRA